MPKKRYRKVLFLFLLFDLVLLSILGFNYYRESLPNAIYILKGDKTDFNFEIPASAIIETISNDYVESVNLNSPFSIVADDIGNYELNVKLFGIFDLKKIELNVIENQKVKLGGIPIGIYVKTKGVLVLATEQVMGKDGILYEPSKNILKEGDYIIKINDTYIYNKAELIDYINKYGDEPLIITVDRNDEEIKLKVEAVDTKDQDKKIGIWVRDDTQGIGTLTFANDKYFGALGHEINDIDTGDILQIKNGKIYKSNILSIVKGKNGKPGELVGTINYSDESLGNIFKNTEYGIFGKPSDSIFKLLDKKNYEIALKQDVKVGKAYIHSYIEGKFIDYEININSVNISNKDISKGMEIEIVDERLLNKTNGIVQGMSGTPIIQDGKLVGAITHVFVQNSVKGYGTFVENMLQEVI